MNTRDISSVRKNFKTDSERLTIHKVHSILCKAKSYNDLGAVSFYSLDEKMRNKYILEFKKLLLGKLDSKLFNLEFSKENALENQNKLLSLKDGNLPKEDICELAEKIIKNSNYDTNVLLTAISATVIVPIKGQKKVSEEDDDLSGFEYSFIMCMVSKVADKGDNLVIDNSNSEIYMESSIDVKDVKNPIEGFTYPCYVDGYVNVNNVLYYTNKADEPNELFIKNILGCERNLTSKGQKELFNNIITTAVGGEVDIETLNSIYEEIKNENTKEESSETINTQDITRILVNKGLGKKEDIEDSIASTINKKEADLIISNIIPTKKVKIKNHNIDLSLSADNLSKIKQVRRNGKTCLIIELDEDVNVEDVKLATK